MAERKLSLVPLPSSQAVGDLLDKGGEPPDDGKMEARVTKLETDLSTIKIDVAVIKANGATKTDIAELKAATKSDIAELKAATKIDIAEAKTSIILWVVTAIFLAQLMPALLKKFGL